MTLVVKNLPANARDLRNTGSIPGSGRFPGERNGYSLQCSCLDNSMARGAWWPSARRVAGSWAWLKPLSTSISEYILFPDSTVCIGLESACQFRRQGFCPWSEKIWHAMRQLSLCAATAEAHVPGVHALQLEGPPQWEAHSPQLERALTQQRRPSTAKKKR